MEKFRLLFTPGVDTKSMQMIDSEAPSPESMKQRAQMLLDLLDKDYTTCTIFAQGEGGRWAPIAIKSKFL